MTHADIILICLCFTALGAIGGFLTCVGIIFHICNGKPKNRRRR